MGIIKEWLDHMRTIKEINKRVGEKDQINMIEIYKGLIERLEKIEYK